MVVGLLILIIFSPASGPVSAPRLWTSKGLTIIITIITIISISISITSPTTYYYYYY